MNSYELISKIEKIHGEINFFTQLRKGKIKKSLYKMILPSGLFVIFVIFAILAFLKNTSYQHFVFIFCFSLSLIFFSHLGTLVIGENYGIFYASTEEISYRVFKKRLIESGFSIKKLTAAAKILQIKTIKPKNSSYKYLKKVLYMTTPTFLTIFQNYFRENPDISISIIVFLASWIIAVVMIIMIIIDLFKPNKTEIHKNIKRYLIESSV